MALSGAKISEQCLKDYQSFKMDHKYDFQLITLTKPNYKTIETAHLEECDRSLSNRQCWEKMRAMLNETDPFFIVFHVRYEHRDGGDRSKIAFISWIPEECSLKDRMVYAATKVYLKTKLEGVAEDPIHATDQGDLEYEEVLKTVSKKEGKPKDK